MRINRADSLISPADRLAHFFLTFLLSSPMLLYVCIALDGSGNTCSGVEITLEAPPNGCGCQPSETEPCTYNPWERTLEDRCYICDAGDLIDSDIAGSEPCDICKACLANCHSCVETATTAADMMACLKSRAMNDGNTDPECRESCSSVCTKIQL